MDEIYRLNFHSVLSSSIRKQSNFKFITRHSGRHTRYYNLCEECNQLLVEKSDEPRDSWPSFLWSILSGSTKSNFYKKAWNCSIYDRGVLWKLIPVTMRPWWIDSVKVLGGPDRPFSEVTLQSPPSIFEDKTIAIKKFDDDFDSQKLSRIVNAMKNEDVVNLNVLCPWNCATCCREAGSVPLDLMFQKMLPKVLIKLYSKHQKYRFVQSSWNQYFGLDGEYPEIMLNSNWPIKPSVKFDNKGMHILTCRYHNNGDDKLYLFPPRSPSGHILNAKQSDQLSHCVKVPRISKPTKAMKYCTKISMVQCRSGFSGVDTMNISTHSDFSKTSELLSQHEDATIIGRKDMNLLLDQKVANKQISSELAASFIQNAKERYSLSYLRQFTQGATYVKFNDMIDIHSIDSSSEKQQIKIINDKPNGRNPTELDVKRSWQCRINLLQTEDCNGYGTQFNSIPTFIRTSNQSLLTWILFAIFSSCKELWKLVDSKESPFRWSGWEGWLLTAIQHHCFKENCIFVPQFSIFKKSSKLNDTIEKINDFCGEEVNYNDLYSSLTAIFAGSDYTDSVVIFESIEDAINSIEDDLEDVENKKVIIIISDDPPTADLLNDTGFELRVICKVKFKNNDKYDAIRYMRHGCGDNAWWKQERSHHITTQCVNGEDIFEELHVSDDNFKFLSLYIRNGDEHDDYCRMNFFKSMGGKTHVQCNCCKFPLIPTQCLPKQKKRCNFKCFFSK